MSANRGSGSKPEPGSFGSFAPEDLDATALAFAETICTEKQMEVVRLRAQGLGQRQIARRLMIHPTTARDRLENAMLHIRRAILERELAEAEAEQDTQGEGVVQMEGESGGVRPPA